MSLKDVTEIGGFEAIKRRETVYLCHFPGTELLNTFGKYRERFFLEIQNVP